MGPIRGRRYASANRSGFKEWNGKLSILAKRGTNQTKQTKACATESLCNDKTRNKTNKTNKSMCNEKPVQR